MKLRREIILIFVLAVSIFLFVIENVLFLTGYAIEGAIPSNVTIERSLAISFSPELSDGILFGEINFLPANNVNATHNYDGQNNGSTFYINVSLDGNSEIDFCIMANTHLTSASSDTIDLPQETYSNSTYTNMSFPSLLNEKSLTTSFVKAGNNIPQGGTNYYRFFLDVLGAQPTGNYNNTITFKGIISGYAC